MEYTPILYKNTTLGPIFAEMVFANDTVAKNYVAIADKIKYKQVLTTVSASFNSVPYSVTPTLPANGGVKFTESEVEPLKWTILEPFEMNSLRQTRFGASMASGAANMESNEFLKAVLEVAIPAAGVDIQNRFWNLVLTKLTSASNEIAVAGTTLTASNIVAELTKVYSAIPAEELEAGQAVIYAPRNVKQLANIVNQDTTKYKNAFAITPDSVKFMDVEILFVPLPANTMIAGKKTEIVLATDLVSDFGQFQIGKVDNIGDAMFMKLDYSLDAGIILPNRKVLYKV